MTNRKLEQQVEFLKNIVRLLEFANDSDYSLVLSNDHLDAKCEHGHHKPMYSDGLALAFKMFRRTPSGHLDYFSLDSDFSLLGKYWKSLDTRCEWNGHIFSMPWRSHADPL